MNNSLKYLVVFLFCSMLICAQTVQLIWPDGDEIYFKDQMHEIRWKIHQMETVRVTVFISYDNGDTWEELSTTSGFKEYYNFIPTIVSDSCMVMLKWDNSESIKSSSVFRVKEAPAKQFNDDYEFININSIKMWVHNGLFGSRTPEGGAGFFWPYNIDTNLTSIFNDGLFIGGIKNNYPFVSGSFWRAGMQPGIILENGKADDPSKPVYKIWKIRKHTDGLQDSELKSALKYDYENWPANTGAPWIDKDNDGIFTRGIDKPDQVGDETLYFVCNDLDTARSLFSYGSFPSGLEVQTTIFGFDRNDVIGNVVFKKHLIINKGSSQLKDAIIAYDVDADLGYAFDDYAGCDTSLNLGYVYNGTDEESQYGNAPPAVGYLILDGIETLGREIKLNYFCPNFKNNASLPMDQDNGVYQGTLEIYNNMKGLLNDGSAFIDPISGDTAKTWFWGDPNSGTGWYEGEGWPNHYDSPGERRFLISSGPFEFSPGDTQEVVYAIIMARGDNNIRSIDELRKSSKVVTDFYKSGYDSNFVVTDIIREAKNTPDYYSLAQNYPNPFNPTTMIEYTLHTPASGFPRLTGRQSSREGKTRGVFVELKVYDILGREVATLVNERQKPGRYQVEFDGTGLASGIYFYELRTINYTKTNKMILLR